MLFRSAYNASAGGKFSYADYSVGLSYDLNGFVLGATYYWNSLKPGTKVYADSSSVGNGGKSDLGANGFAVSLTRSF